MAAIGFPYHVVLTELGLPVPDHVSGPELQILCPFHAETAPSCRINLQSGLWKCYGCGAKGTGISFVQRFLACTYEEATAKVRTWLAPEEAEEPTEAPAPPEPPRPPRRRLRPHRQALALASGWLWASVERHREDAEVVRLVKTRSLGELCRYLAKKDPIAVMDQQPRLRAVALREVGQPAWWQAVEDVVAQTVNRHNISNQLITFYEDQLTPERAQRLMAARGYTRSTLRRFRIGWDSPAERYTIPVVVDGVCVNLRRYRLGAAEMKMVSYAEGYGAPRFFPQDEVRGSGQVFWLEGEPDTLLAQQMGLPAVTVTGGAGTVPVGYIRVVQGKEVVVVFDCDAAGRQGAARVAQTIYPYTRSLKVVDLGLPYRGGDYTDYVRKEGHTLDDFLALVQQTPPYTPR